MPIKLTYFDMAGGAEPTRLAFYVGGIPFEDIRVTREQWVTLKPQQPFGEIPVLEVDGRKLTQHVTILKYAGKLAGLYPEDFWMAAKADEVMDVITEAKFMLPKILKERDPGVKGQIEEDLLSLLGRIDALLVANGGSWAVGESMTVADLCLFVAVDIIQNVPLAAPRGFLQSFRKLSAVHERVKAHPKVAEYYAQRGR